MLALLCVPQMVQARPIGTSLFCAEQPDSPLCAGTSTTCSLCHTSTSPDSPSWNGFGNAVYGQLAQMGEWSFEDDLADALLAVMAMDSDGDGATNAEEITVGSLPGDPDSVLAEPLTPLGEPNPVYALGDYDVAYAYKRVAIAFCGRSPTYDEMEDLATSPDPTLTLHAKADECLESDYWRDTALPRLADPKVRPIDFGTSWNWDYRLWRWVMTGDRDMRELLDADYHVREPAPGELEKVAGILLADSGISCAKCTGATQEADCGPGGVCNPGTSACMDADCEPDQLCLENAVGGATCRFKDGGQELEVDKRAGMITTAWFHFYNTMFSALPRQTAAQAYRAYAGLNIARQQGLEPAVDEPLDLDNKGVKQAECAQCHTTLDPLTYAFAYHHGIGGGPSSSFDENRPKNVGLWKSPASAPPFVIFGQTVTDVRGWAEVVAESDVFARMITETLYHYALGHGPKLEDMPEFMALWQSLPDVGWTASGLVHAIIDTAAFGAP